MIFYHRIRRFISKALGRRRCNICDWRGWEFGSDHWHPYTICPQCQCQVRHRLMMAALLHLHDYSLSRLVDGRRILHIAPEPALSAIIAPRAERYVTADFLLPGFDLQINLCHMPEVKDESFDILIACDVLEHVPNDNQALAEIFRVLSHTGTAVLTVPQIDNREFKIELPLDATPEERLRLAAQEDHQRIYGSDFPNYVRDAGFDVTVVSSSNFPDSVVRRYALKPPILSTHPLATNHRSIYFAHKASN